MFTCFRVLVWSRNIIAVLGGILGFKAFSLWQSAGKNFDLMETPLFVIALCLVVVPIIAVGITKSLLIDKMKRLIDEGKKLLESNEYQKAIEILDKAIFLKDNIVTRVLPDEMVAYLYRGNAYAKLNNSEKSLSDLERLIKINSDYVGWKKLKEEANQIKEELQKNIEVSK